MRLSVLERYRGIAELCGNAYTSFMVATTVTEYMSQMTMCLLHFSQSQCHHLLIDDLSPDF